MGTTQLRFDRARGQRGLTLIEFMVAIVLGMIMVAAIATLIANQSTNRAEADRAGRMIENGRYALQSMAQDVEMAGYWGELGSPPAIPATLPGPCTTAVSGAAGNLQEAMGLHVQGYDALTTLPPELSCVKNFKPGTDILVVRHVDPVTTDVESGGAVDWSKLTRGQVYLQTGISGISLASVLAAADGSTDSTTFNLTKRNGAVASPRKYLVHIYYIANCSVEASGGTCTGADGGSPIPTLKRVDLSASGGATAMSNPITIAEGIENMQIDYGLDSDADGASDGVDGTGSGFTVANWADVMTLKIYLLARSSEQSPGYSDTAGANKSYAMGAAGAVSAPAGAEAYRRHVFVQSVRLINPSSRRAP